MAGVAARPGRASCTPASSAGQARQGTAQFHERSISRLRAGFNGAGLAAAPVGIAPGLPGGHGGPRLWHRVFPARPAGTTPREAAKRHPAARPDPVPRHGFRPELGTGRMMPAPRPEHIEQRRQCQLVGAQEKPGNGVEGLRLHGDRMNGRRTLINASPDFLASYEAYSNHLSTGSFVYK